MTTTATTPIACPDWCQTSAKCHENDPDAGHEGPRWPNVPSIYGTSGTDTVSIGTGLDPKHGAYVYIEATGLELTPEQARTAGLALLSAASWGQGSPGVEPLTLHTSIDGIRPKVGLDSKTAPGRRGEPTRDLDRITSRKATRS
jgi:hypothetical protein